MKTGMIGILNNPSSSHNSHSAGWNEVLRQQIAKDLNGTCTILNEKDNWDEYEKLIVNHGPNFKPGAFNVIGGINEQVLERTAKLIKFKGLVKQIDGFQLNSFLQKRLSDTGLKYVNNIHPYILKKRDKTLLGDSHAISVWPGTEYTLDRRDGKTLYGFLRSPEPAQAYYFGNIDIRFHLARQPDPKKATLELAKRYIQLASKHEARVTLLLPVEPESRKLPGTGKYKGENFFGSAALRTSLVNYFNDELRLSGLQLNEWPSEWYEDPEFFMAEVMEPRQSVHIRPKYYQARLKLS